jgi:hypothetical protein
MSRGIFLFLPSFDHHISIWLHSWSSTFAPSKAVIYFHLWVRTYFNVCEILNICRIPVDRLAGVTDAVWEEGVAVVNKYGPTGQHDVSQWGLQRKLPRRLASRLKIGVLSRLFSRRPDVLPDTTTLVRPVTRNCSPDNRVSRSLPLSPSLSALVSMHH